MTVTKLTFGSDGSFIDTVAYDPSTKELTVFLRAGKSYNHPNVPEHVFFNFMKAESHGNYYNTEIKTHYPSRKSRAEIKRNEDAFNCLLEIVNKARGGMVSINDEIKKAREIVFRVV